MTAPPEPRLHQLIARLRAAALDLTAEQIADAVWLARWMTAREEPRCPAGPGPAAAGPASGPRQPELATGAPPAPSAAPAAPAATRRAERTAPVSLYAEGRAEAPARPRERPEVFPVRVPAAGALPGLLGLQRSLRPLRGYRSLAAPLPGPLDEQATADRGARTGVLQPVYRPGARQAAGMQLLMDTSSSMVVWERMLEELQQTCAQLGVFRDVQVRYLHRGPDGTPLIGTTAAPRGEPELGLRPADQFRDPTGRRLTLVISDCVGPLWRQGRAQRLLHHWSRTSPVAIVQPLPPRLWSRTALSAQPGLLVRDPLAGGRLGFEPDGFRRPARPGALPVPVLLPVREALGAWARLLSGPGRSQVRGAAAWLLPGHPALPEPAEDGDGRGADERLRSFRAGASSGALRLAVHLAAVPLTLPVMQLVQRAMLPDTGPMELAEVLLSGLLWRLPDHGEQQGTGPWYEFADGVRELLLQSLEQGEAALVLKHCSDYVERQFGKSARNFSALAVAQLTGEAAAGGESGTPEPELFARVPARVVRWYRRVPAETGPLAEAEALLALWHAQGDPELLHRARGLAEPALGQDVDAVRAHLVLGKVLRALAGTEDIRREPAARRETLQRAAAVLAEAHRRTEAGSRWHTEAGLELAAVRHAAWQTDGEEEQLHEAERVLRALPPGSRRHLRLGRVLLDLARTGPEPPARATEAAAELRAGCALLDAEDAPAVRRCAARLDLARALRLAGAPAPEVLAALAQAESAAVDDPQRLHCRTESARTHAARRDWPPADAAYQAAVSLTGRDDPRRSELLAEWGELLLGRAEHGDDETVSRAEAVLREAFAVVPGRSPLRSGLQLLLGRALVLRAARLGYLPDLYESCHLLEQAARRAPDGAVRAEAWLALGTARLALREHTAAVPLADAAAAFAAAAEEAGRQSAEPGSVTAARAWHRYGQALERMGLHRQALAAYRDAARQWRDLTARLAEVPWDEVQETRESVARLSGG
ncbi:SAV_2336 N-terminal domain-related protein [Streptomyces sp. NPDC052396]|uniref:SAV_2336 N-terminal domain-related protein n=1 Tax=Streptomyces sp. NPDC052396 TaxID=3365689 RepID=UPI0037D228BD